MKIAKRYLGALLSIVALAAYFSPWYGDAHGCLGFYIISFLWFLFIAWPTLLVHLVLMVLNIRKHNKDWKHHLTAAIMIIFCYLGLFIGVANNYVMTV